MARSDRYRISRPRGSKSISFSPAEISSSAPTSCSISVPAWEHRTPATGPSSSSVWAGSSRDTGPVPLPEIGIGIEASVAARRARMRIPAHRLDCQLIYRHRFAAAADVVAWFGAMQAQDYLAAQWALGLRTPRATEATIEAAIASGRVIRTHLFRGTWQYVAREDVRWTLGLVGARVIASRASRYRELDLDARTLRRCGELFAKALVGGQQLTRREMGAVLAR